MLLETPRFLETKQDNDMVGFVLYRKRLAGTAPLTPQFFLGNVQLF